MYLCLCVFVLFFFPLSKCQPLGNRVSMCSDPSPTRFAQDHTSCIIDAQYISFWVSKLPCSHTYLIWKTIKLFAGNTKNLHEGKKHSANREGDPTGLIKPCSVMENEEWLMERYVSRYLPHGIIPDLLFKWETLAFPSGLLVPKGEGLHLLFLVFPTECSILKNT